MSSGFLLVRLNFYFDTLSMRKTSHVHIYECTVVCRVISSIEKVLGKFTSVIAFFAFHFDTS